MAPSAHIAPAETHGSPPVSLSGLVRDDKMSICFPLAAPMKCSTECTEAAGGSQELMHQMW